MNAETTGDKIAGNAGDSENGIDIGRLNAFVTDRWDEDIVDRLTEYIRIPCKSPAFDADWARAGHFDAAVELLTTWARTQIAGIVGARLDVLRLEGRTPTIIVEIPGNSAETVLLYGHFDKQPEMEGWSQGLGPWTPVLREGRLYGRGGADDGYALFAAITAILGLRAQGIRHGRCVILIEGSEESGSPDLPAIIAHLAPRIGRPSLAVCLDSGCGNYDQLWLTTSLRGLTGGKLTVEVLNEGVHSGAASGIVPSSLRLLRILLGRLEDAATGAIVPSAFHAPIPAARVRQAEVVAAALGEVIAAAMPWAPGMQPVTPDPAELLLNRTWRPQLAVIGADGLPPTTSAGNVLRPRTTLALSLRLPPTLDAAEAGRALKALLEADPPYGATVRFEPGPSGSGWEAPALAAWLEASLDRASRKTFGREVALAGEGGSIPFMGMLGAALPDAQFVVTGVLGPHSNAHGPDEFLDIATARKVTAAIAIVLADHARAFSRQAGDVRGG